MWWVESTGSNDQSKQIIKFASWFFCSLNWESVLGWVQEYWPVKNKPFLLPAASIVSLQKVLDRCEVYIYVAGKANSWIGCFLIAGVCAAPQPSCVQSHLKSWEGRGLTRLQVYWMPSWTFWDGKHKGKLVFQYFVHSLTIYSLCYLTSLSQWSKSKLISG